MKILIRILKSNYIRNSLLSIYKFLLIYIFAIFLFIFKSKRNRLNPISGKVLVIATGPSLSKLNQEIINDSDSIVLCNSAFEILNNFEFSGKKIYLFIFDSYRLETIIKKGFHIRKDINLVINPMHFFNINIYIKACLKFNCKKFFIFPIPKFANRANIKFETNTLLTYKCLVKNGFKIKKFRFLNTLPIIPKSIVFNVFYVILVLQKRNLTKNITFIGCDFKGSKSSNLISEQKGWIAFDNKKLLFWYKILKDIAASENINVERIL